MRSRHSRHDARTVISPISQSSTWRRRIDLKCCSRAVLQPHTLAVLAAETGIGQGHTYNRSITMDTANPYQVHDSTLKPAILGLVPILMDTELAHTASHQETE
jgi:hypothetical protein